MLRQERTGHRPRIVGIGGTLRQDSLSRIALERALAAAEIAGAEIELLDLNALDLPIFRPSDRRGSLDPQVERLLRRVSAADGMLWSTAAYHGTLAGVTKNALDHLDHLGDGGYLNAIPVGMIAVSGGDMAAVTAIDAMVHAAHALRAVVVPLKVPIGKVRQRITVSGRFVDESLADRLEHLGGLVVEMAALRPLADPVGRAA